MSDFFNNSDISQQQAEGLVSETLNKCDDGELFLENTKIRVKTGRVCPCYKTTSSFDILFT